MKQKIRFILIAAVVLLLLGTVYSQERIPVRLKVITSVSQVNYGIYIEIVVTGTNFPDPRESCQIMIGDYPCIPGSCWSSTKACGGLSFNILPGKTYPVRIVESAITKKPITISKDYFLLTNLYDIKYSERLKPGVEIEILSALNLGDKGDKVVKFDNAVVPTLEWKPGSFKIRIPSHVENSFRHYIWIEENGKLISNKIPLTLPRLVK